MTDGVSEDHRDTVGHHTCGMMSKTPRAHSSLMPLQFVAPKLNGVIETALYVRNLSRAKQFYEGVLGLKVLRGDQRFCAFDVAGGHVLLLFQRGTSAQPISLPGGVIPPHDGHGTEHVGFQITADSLRAWEDWLARRKVAIESRVTWERGGTSLYFRDPDGHLLELLTPGVWETY